MPTFNLPSWFGSTTGTTWARRAAIVVGVAVTLRIGKALLSAHSKSRFAKEVAKQKKNVVYLYGFPRLAALRTPIIGPTACKVETFLRLAKVPYVFVGTQDYSNSPTERLPFIALNGQLTAESYFIMERVTKEFQVTLDDFLAAEDHAKGNAIRRIIDDSIRLHHYRHQTVNHPEQVAQIFSKAMGAPLFIAKFFVRSLRSNMIDLLNKHGQGDLTEEQFRQEWMRDISSLEVFLGDKPFFFGDRPSSYDCAAYGYLAIAIVIADLIPCAELTRIRDGPLGKFTKRMEAAAFPDLDTILKAPQPQEFLTPTKK